MGSGELGRCPACAAFLQHDALACPRCGADFRVAADPSINFPKARRINNIVIVLIVMISAIAAVVSLWR